MRQIPIGVSSGKLREEQLRPGSGGDTVIVRVDFGHKQRFFQSAQFQSFPLAHGKSGIAVVLAQHLATGIDDVAFLKIVAIDLFGDYFGEGDICGSSNSTRARLSASGVTLAGTA